MAIRGAGMTMIVGEEEEAAVTATVAKTDMAGTTATAMVTIERSEAARDTSRITKIKDTEEEQQQQQVQVQVDIQQIITSK
jgi:hypothetical protein